MEYKITSEKIERLVHELTKQKCEAIRIRFEYENPFSNEMQYYPDAQKWHDHYYNLVFQTLIA
jgi:hypothetical protein